MIFPVRNAFVTFRDARIIDPSSKHHETLESFRCGGFRGKTVLVVPAFRSSYAFLPQGFPQEASMMRTQTLLIFAMRIKLAMIQNPPIKDEISEMKSARERFLAHERKGRKPAKP